MPRIAAALALVIGVALLGAYLHLIGTAPWVPASTRHLTTQKHRRVAPASFQPLSFADLVALPAHPTAAERQTLESRGVMIEGYVQRMIRAIDGDLHLDLAPVGPPGWSFAPYAIAEITPEWRRGSDRWRFDALVARFQPRIGGVTPWESAPRRVRLRGPLLDDDAHERTRPARGGAPALSTWEIHPVTGIELWDDRAQRFVEYPR